MLLNASKAGASAPPMQGQRAEIELSSRTRQRSMLRPFIARLAHMSIRFHAPRKLFHYSISSDPKSEQDDCNDGIHLGSPNVARFST
jgi:hypothetical protein